MKPKGKIWDGQAGMGLSGKLKTMMDGTCCYVALYSTHEGAKRMSECFNRFQEKEGNEDEEKEKKPPRL